jgi:hypothetical protein
MLACSVQTGLRWPFLSEESMQLSRRSLKDRLGVCLVVLGAVGALFGFTLFVTALLGKNLASDLLLGGFGLLLLLLSVLGLVFVIARRESSRHD